MVFLAINTTKSLILVDEVYSMKHYSGIVLIVQKVKKKKTTNKLIFNWYSSIFAVQKVDDIAKT